MAINYLFKKVLKEIAIGTAIFLLTSLNISNASDSLACSRLSASLNPGSRWRTAHCNNDPSQKGFNPCVVEQFSHPFHSQIHNTLYTECQTERQVEEMRRNYDYEVERIRRLPGDHPEPRSFQSYLSPDQQQIMHRLRPSEFSDPSAPPNESGSYSGGPMRSDSCFGDQAAEFLSQQAEARCNPESVETACRNATNKTREVLGEANRATQHAMSHRSPAGALEFAKRRQDILNGLRLQLQEANDSCSGAITALQNNGCMTLYQEYFRDPIRADLFGKYCTHEGLQRNIDIFAENMRTQITPAVIEYTDQHIKNREDEDAVAEEFVKLSNFIIQLQEQLEPTANRAPASGTPAE